MNPIQIQSLAFIRFENKIHTLNYFPNGSQLVKSPQFSIGLFIGIIAGGVLVYVIMQMQENYLKAVPNA